MIPAELYRNIVGNLDHDEDRRTLTSVAECSVTLRDEGQRVLFRSTRSEIWLRGDPVRRHTLFLRAFLESPQRLALYVKDFAQRNASWEPGCMPETAKDDPAYEAKAEVFRLTMQSLPLMVNLKKLYYSPACATDSADIFRQCTFQLAVLEWLPLRGGDALSQFLSTQKMLHHITGVWAPGEKLSDGILPKLESVRGNPTTFIALQNVVRHDQIRAFDCYHPCLEHEHITLSGIKYLRASTIYMLRSTQLGFNLAASVVVLEITCWFPTNLGPLECLPPNIYALVLRHGLEDLDIPLPTQREMKSAARAAFLQRPSLRYVDFCPLDSLTGLRALRPSPLFPAITLTPLTFSDNQTEWWKRHIIDNV